MFYFRVICHTHTSILLASRLVIRNIPLRIIAHHPELLVVMVDLRRLTAIKFPILQMKIIFVAVRDAVGFISRSNKPTFVTSHLRKTNHFSRSSWVNSMCLGWKMSYEYAGILLNSIQVIQPIVALLNFGLWTKFLSFEDKCSLGVK